MSKSRKTEDLQQILENDKGGRFYAELLKLSNKLHKNKLQKICRFVLHYFQARARPRYFRGLCQVSACFYRTVWRILNRKSGAFPWATLKRIKNRKLPKAQLDYLNFPAPLLQNATSFPNIYAFSLKGQNASSFWKISSNKQRNQCL